ncbi:MAG: TfoX/Sxy family protein [Oscillospiraceae bacterium]
MASSKEYLEVILDRLSELEDISHRAMMGEYIIYYKGRIAAYICDDRLLVKPVEAAKDMMPQARYEPPYEGAKDMLLVENVDDRQFLTRLFQVMYDQLPEPKPKKKRIK